MKISAENLSVIKKDYETFKKSIQYEERKKQLLFSDFARTIIEKVVQKDSITNVDLTSLIQIFGYGSKHDNVKKYIDSLKLDDTFSKEIFDKFVESGQTGFTGRGKHTIQNLTLEHLLNVHTFLKSVLHSDSEEQIKKIVYEYERNSIPQVTYGVYSPWLYYIHPTICPIVVGPVKQYLKKMGWDQKNYLDAWDMLEQINQEVNEENYGFFDAFIYENSLTTDSNYWLFIVPKTYEDGRLWDYCKENNLAAMHYDDVPGYANITRNRNLIKKIQLRDRVVVYLNDNKIGGIGEVTQEFYEDLSKNNGFDGSFGQRIDLDWLSPNFEVDIKQLMPFLTKFPKALHLQTIHEVDKEDFEKIFKLVDKGIIDDSALNVEYVLSSEINLLYKKKQIILYGPPGTGKTFNTKNLAVNLIRSSSYGE